jgi:hypothetical protein
MAGALSFFSLFEGILPRAVTSVNYRPGFQLFTSFTSVLLLKGKEEVNTEVITSSTSAPFGSGMKGFLGRE